MASPMSEIITGAGLLREGFRVVLRRPRLFRLGAIPPLIVSILFTAILVALITQLDSLTDWATPFADSWNPTVALIVRIVLAVAFLLALVLVMAISFTTVTLTAGFPWYDKISEAVEDEGQPDDGGSPAATTSPPGWVWRSIRQSTVLIAVSIVVGIALFFVGLIPLVGQLSAPVASALFGGWMLGIELIGSSFERHGRLTLAERLTAMRRARWRVLGFAVPSFWLLAIPVVGVLAFPAATVGGTLLARSLLADDSAGSSTALRL